MSVPDLAPDDDDDDICISFVSDKFGARQQFGGNISKTEKMDIVQENTEVAS